MLRLFDYCPYEYLAVDGYVREKLPFMQILRYDKLYKINVYECVC